MKNRCHGCVTGDAVTARLYKTSLKAVETPQWISHERCENCHWVRVRPKLRRSERIQVVLHKHLHQFKILSTTPSSFLPTTTLKKYLASDSTLELRLTFGSRSWRHDPSLVFRCVGAIGDHCKDFRINLAPTFSKGAEALLAALMVAKA